MTQRSSSAQSWYSSCIMLHVKGNEENDAEVILGSVRWLVQSTPFTRSVKGNEKAQPTRSVSCNEDDAGVILGSVRWLVQSTPFTRSGKGNEKAECLLDIVREAQLPRSGKGHEKGTIRKNRQKKEDSVSLSSFCEIPPSRIGAMAVSQ